MNDPNLVERLKAVFYLAQGKGYPGDGHGVISMLDMKGAMNEIRVIITVSSLLQAWLRKEGYILVVAPYIYLGSLVYYYNYL